MTFLSPVVRLASALLAISTAAGLTGCGGAASGDAGGMAEWIREQPGVLGATATPEPSPFSGEIAVEVAVDPAIDDEALGRLARDVSAYCAEAGWLYPTVEYTVGDEGRFNDREEAFLPLFLRLRDESGFSDLDLVDGVSAEVASSDPADLLQALTRLRELARESGGVQSNLDFTIQDKAETILVSGTYTESPDQAVAALPALVDGIATLWVRAFAIETDAQVLSIVVPDESARSLVQERATSIDGVEVDVWLADELEDAGPDRPSE